MFFRENRLLSLLVKDVDLGEPDGADSDLMLFDMLSECIAMDLDELRDEVSLSR